MEKRKRQTVASKKNITSQKNIIQLDTQQKGYQEYLQSEHWKTTSRLAKEHYGNICNDCGNKENIEVHHLNYDRIGEERLEDLQLLCRYCHEKEFKKAINKQISYAKLKEIE